MSEARDFAKDLGHAIDYAEHAARLAMDKCLEKRRIDHLNALGQLFPHRSSIRTWQIIRKFGDQIRKAHLNEKPALWLQLQVLLGDIPDGMYYLSDGVILLPKRSVPAGMIVTDLGDGILAPTL